MTKVIENIELLKKLQPYLKETKYGIFNDGTNFLTYKL